MVAGLALAALTLRAGLALRRSRLGRQPRAAGLRRTHLRIAKPAVVVILVGFVGGPVSAWWLRGWEPLGTFHALVGTLVAGLFAAAAVAGRRIETGASRGFDAHALLGGLALLLGALAAVAGFALLP
jgi:hypothetical protein